MTVADLRCQSHIKLHKGKGQQQQWQQSSYSPSRSFTFHRLCVYLLIHLFPLVTRTLNREEREEESSQLSRSHPSMCTLPWMHESIHASQVERERSSSEQYTSLCPLCYSTVKVKETLSVSDWRARERKRERGTKRKREEHHCM